jgi:hypothetical protein
MLGLLIIFVLLAAGFAAGYATRELVSRQRRAEYLRYEPYVSPSARPKQPPASLVQPDKGKKIRGAASEPPMTVSIAKAASRRTNHDITRSFQDIDMQGSKPAGANLYLAHPRPKEPDVRPARPASVEESVEELLALLQRRRRER